MANRQTAGRIGPPYTFKLVRGKGKRERIEVLKPCSSYTIVKQWDDEAESYDNETGDPIDGGAQVGWELLLTREPREEGEMVLVPQDAHTVYVENVNGKTVQTFRWPEKVKEKGKVSFRVMDDPDDQDRQETRS